MDENLFGKRRDIIISNKDQFYKLGLERQIEVISNLHRFIKSGVPGRIDLEELGVKSGNLTMNYKIEDLSIIKQSITGLYQKEIIIKQV